jgi:hypothetical protein
MELDAFAGNIPSISKALKSLDAAYSSSSTFVFRIQDALIHLNFALLDENLLIQPFSNNIPSRKMLSTILFSILQTH